MYCDKDVLKAHLNAQCKSMVAWGWEGGDCKGPKGTFLGGGRQTQVHDLPKLKVTKIL